MNISKHFEIKHLMKIMGTVIICVALQNIFYVFAIQNEVLSIDELSAGVKNIKHIVAVFLFFFAYLFTSLIYAFVESQFIGIIRNTIYDKAWKRFYKMNLADQVQKESGNEINFFVTKIENVSRFYYGGVFHIVSYMVAYIMCLVLVLYHNLIVGITCFACTILLIILGSIQSKKIVKKQNELQKANEQVIETDLSLLKGQVTITNFQAYRKAEKDFIESNNEYENSKFNYNQYMNFFELTTIIGNTVVYFLIFVICCIFAYKNKISIGFIAAMITLCSQLIMKGNSIMFELGTVMGLSEIKKEVIDYINYPDEEKPEKMIIKDNRNTPIKIEGVTMGYQNKTVIEDISITLKEGEKIALIGESGIGKTTLLYGIIKRIPVLKGKIELWGKSVAELSEDAIFENVCYIEQNPVIFEGTIFENITLGYDSDNMEYCKKVFEMMNLEKDGLRLEDHLKQDGTNISQGQKQRISLARGLFRRKKILLLDEPFSALDEQNAIEIESRLMAIPDISVICISHRILDTSRYDQMVELTSTGCKLNDL